jgi:four helix bundle protein
MEIKEKDNIIVQLTFQFSLEIIEYCELLEENKKFVISKQLLRSGTSIGANVREAQHAESKADFIHKLKIAIKELEETEYWLELCEQAKKYPNHKDLLDKTNTIKKILSKIIITSKTKK